MKSESSCSERKQLNATSAVLALFVFFVAAPCASAGAPEWLRAAARAPVPSYPAETHAVLLYAEQITTVTEKGEIKSIYRYAYKILRPQGRDHGVIAVFYDTETKLTFLKGGCIPAQGGEYEVKEKDALETTPFTGALYEDTRLKILRIPAADPGNVIGYEYEQKRRAFVLQDTWRFQEEVPVRSARFLLQLPKGWAHEAVWLNHPARPPRAAGENQWVWEVENLPGVEPEPSMPHLRAILGRLAVTFFPGDEAAQAKSHSAWQDVGKWYSQLAYPRRQASPAIQQKVAELTAGADSTIEKIRRLAAFAQRDIRYVAIEIGIGGYQPNAAPQIFTNRYGDCKDKATLLSAMLMEIGIESYYVLLHSDRGAVAPGFPSMTNFNHVILAIRVPDDVSTAPLFALQSHAQLGNLLFFDPTSTITPLGFLPSGEQASHALLVTEQGGELLQLPLQAAATNRLLRTGKFSLSPSGSLSGEVREIRTGAPATARRGQLLDAPGTDRTKVLENFLGSFLSGFRVTNARVDNLERYDESLVLSYRFVSENYAQATGDLLLFRPRILGEKGSDLLEGKSRKYPVEFDEATLQTDVFEFALPPGFRPDEIPPPVEVKSSFGEYRSKVEIEGNVLRYTRNYQINEVLVPLERMDELKKFYRRIAADERANAVLKRGSPGSP